MKRITYIALLTFLPLQIFAHTTGICIFDDKGDPKSWEKAAIKNEFAKTLDNKPDHLFITPTLWCAYKKKFNKTKHAKTFCDRYHLYNTHIGLLYIKHNDAPKNIGINIRTFTSIPFPFQATAAKQIKTGKWAKKINKLFDMQAWQSYHNQHNRRSFIYMNGHGTRQMCHFGCSMAAGISGANFAHLLRFFNEDLKIDVFGMQSCFWTSKRILKIMKQHFGYQDLHFSILTPLKSEKELWLTNFEPCSCGECTNNMHYTFFYGLQKVTNSFKGIITQQLKTVIKKIDTLNIPKKRHQSATLIAAGTQSVMNI